MTLNRLSQDDVEAIIAAIFEQENPVKPEFAAAIQSLADRNLFFIEETLKALITSEDIYYGMGGWTRKPIDELQIPRTVQDAVQYRIAPLIVKTRKIIVPSSRGWYLQRSVIAHASRARLACDPPTAALDSPIDGLHHVQVFQNLVGRAVYLILQVHFCHLLHFPLETRQQYKSTLNHRDNNPQKWNLYFS